jgi:hypothetical protein
MHDVIGVTAQVRVVKKSAIDRRGDDNLAIRMFDEPLEFRAPVCRIYSHDHGTRYRSCSQPKQVFGRVVEQDTNMGWTPSILPIPPQGGTTK